MSEVKVKEEGEGELVPCQVKLEPGAIKSSLGALLTSYGGDNESGEEDEDGYLDIPRIKEWNSKVGRICEIKMEVEGNVEIKEEETVDDKQDEDKPFKEESLTDFARIRVKNEEDEDKKEKEIELCVEDFLEGSTVEPSSSYAKIRPIKVELSSGTEDSETDSDTESDDNDSEEEEAKDGKKGKKPPREGPKVKGEMSWADLPPIEDLHISVPHDKCKPIGIIKSFVDPLIIVEAYPETPALNLDTVLFLDQGDRALGHVFDVIGPVTAPIYCVRFNGKEHIEKNKVEIGMLVYCAPGTQYTSFVFLAQLRRLKGSDASWVNDIEPPKEEVEFSDDEQERIAKKKKKTRLRQRNRAATEQDAVGESSTSSSNEQRSQRPQKRSFNNLGKGAQPNNNNQAPFSPALVPGFIPPWMTQAAANFAHNRPPHHQQHRRGQRFRGGGFRFHGGAPFHRQPPPPQRLPQYGPAPIMNPMQFNPFQPQNNFNQPQRDNPWCPPPPLPPQHYQQSRFCAANFNFGPIPNNFTTNSNNQPRQGHSAALNVEPPPPPPPPPPPLPLPPGVDS